MAPTCTSLRPSQRYDLAMNRLVNGDSQPTPALALRTVTRRASVVCGLLSTVDGAEVNARWDWNLASQFLPADNRLKQEVVLTSVTSADG